MSKINLSAKEAMESPIQSKFANELDFPLANASCVGKSKVKKDGNNKGKTLLRFAHDLGANFSIGAGDFRVLCTEAGVDFVDADGNVVDQNCECPSGKLKVVA